MQGWVKSLTAKGLAPATVKLVYGVFASVLRAAVADDRLARSPCIGVALPAVPKTVVRCLTPGQVTALAEAMPPQYAALVYLGACAGLRQGEAFGVGADRVNWLRHMLRVERQVTTTGQRPDGTPGQVSALTAPKSAAGVRDVPLPAALLESLSLHVARFGSLGPNGCLFANRSGGLLHRGHFNEGPWRRAVALCAAAGVPADTTFHDLRHTYASTLLGAGVPITDVSKWLGHASITETVDTYGHLLKDADQTTRLAIDKAFAERSLGAAGGADFDAGVALVLPLASSGA